MHAIDGDLDRCLGRAAAGEHRVHRLHPFVVMADQSGHDRLGQKLTAEYHSGAGVGVLGPVPVRTDRLQGQ